MFVDEYDMSGTILDFGGKVVNKTATVLMYPIVHSPVGDSDRKIGIYSMV